MGVRPLIFSLLFALAGVTCVSTSSDAATDSQVVRVGPQHRVKRIADAAKIARDGAVVLIEPSDYVGDVATWHQSNLTIRGVSCCARVSARGASAEGKAIWVIKGDNVVVENVDLRGARVPHKNGAGIRHEGGRLVVRNSRFSGNEMGILTWNESHAELVVEGSEFDRNGIAGEPRAGDWVGHQIYVGRIGRFTLRGSYVHHGHFGHLVKSRARENFIEYNRITDEEGGRASYELELPNGGVAYVVGNIIQQGTRTENATMIAFGAEGYVWPRNELYLVNNTIVDSRFHLRPSLLVRSGADALEVVNNLLVTTGSAIGNGQLATEPRARAHDVPRARQYDFRLREASELVGTAQDPGQANGVSLRPVREYVHPRNSRPIAPVPYSPGALQSRVQ